MTIGACQYKQQKRHRNKFENLYETVKEKKINCPTCGKAFTTERRKPYIILECQNPSCANCAGKNPGIVDSRHGGYVRKSAEDSRKQVQSIQDQIDRVKELAEFEALDLAFVIVEEKTAHSPGREGFAELMNRMRNGEINSFLCWRANRLARNMRDGGEICHAVQTGRLKQIKTVKEIFDEHTDMAYLSAQFGQSTQYSITLSQDVRDGLASCRKKGLFPGMPPIGFRKGTEEEKKMYGKSAKFPDHNFKFIKPSFELYRQGTHSYEEVAEEMAGRGMTTQTGRPMTKGSMERVLKNSFYCNKNQWRCSKTGVIDVYKGKQKQTITKQLYKEVQATINGKRVCGSGERKHNHIFAKMVRCKCGRFLIPARHKVHVYLECHNRRACKASFMYNQQQRPKKSLRTDDVEGMLGSEFERLSLSGNVIEELKGWLIENNSKELKQTEELQKEYITKINSIDQELKTLSRKLISGLFSDEEFVEIRDELRESRAKLSEEKDKLGIHVPDVLAETTMMFGSIGKILKNEFSNLPTELKSRCLELFFGTLEAQSTSLVINYSKPAKELLRVNPENDSIEPQRSQSCSENTEVFETPVSHGGFCRGDLNKTGNTCNRFDSTGHKKSSSIT